MRKETILAVVLGIAMVSGLLIIGFVIWRSLDTKDDKKVNSSNKQTSYVDSDSSLSVGNNSGVGGGLDNQAQNLGQSGELSTGSSGQPQNENLTAYEKYSKEKSALYQDIKKGEGAEVKMGSKVAIYYLGRLTTGEKFDNQWPAKPGDTPKTFDFEIGSKNIIAGLQQGLFGMKPGGKRRIIVPPAVGYGEKGQGSIPPDSLLIFDVELKKVD